MLVELIIIVAIVWWVVKKKKDAVNGGNPGNGAGPQVTVTPANQQKDNTDYFRKNTTPKSNAGTRNAVEEAKQDGHSTTAYLMEKAQADAGSMPRRKWKNRRDCVKQEEILPWQSGCLMATRFRREKDVLSAAIVARRIWCR